MTPRWIPYLILGAAAFTLLTAPLWLWQITGEWPAFVGTGVVVWGALPIGCLVGWALVEVIR